MDGKTNCRSELAREELKDTAFNQTERVIVDVFREQARSYSDRYNKAAIIAALLYLELTASAQAP